MPKSLPLLLLVVLAQGGCIENSREPDGASLHRPARLDVHGGTMDKLDFAIVGDTRPALVDDTADYPIEIITRIWQGVADELVRPNFAVTTGTYWAVNPDSVAAAREQLHLYLRARRHFSGPVYFGMGEPSDCSGGTTMAAALAPACRVLMEHLLGPWSQKRPYYALHVVSTDRTWTAKFVFVSAQPWDDAEASWLQAALSLPTTYTFVIRPKPWETTGLLDGVLSGAPITLILAGGAPVCAHDPAHRQLIVGNGGAPLGDSSQHGYVIARQRPDGAMEMTAYEYDTHRIAHRFALNPDGSPVAVD